MIVQTTRISVKGGVRYLACHLLDKIAENDAIEILAGDRHALSDAHALARAKGCKFSVRHLSVSPQREMDPAQLSKFLRSIDDEFLIGTARPRLIVRHVKNNRSHFHIAIAEVDPRTLRVMDCRNDYARLEAVARRYEQDHGETVQPTRAERHHRKTEGFSDVARKRAERTMPAFDRTKLKQAFSVSHEAFLAELARQGLTISDGDKGPILINHLGQFVAAANRAVGVRRVEFSKFMEENKNGGNYFRVAELSGVGGTQSREAAASPFTPGDSGRPRSIGAALGPSGVHIRRPTPAGRGAKNRGRSARPPLTPLVRHHREHFFLCRLRTVDLDDLLRRAEELAAWMRSIFEPQAQRLSRKIQELKQGQEPIVPAEISKPAAATYDLKRRMSL